MWNEGLGEPPKPAREPCALPKMTYETVSRHLYQRSKQTVSNPLIPFTDVLKISVTKVPATRPIQTPCITEKHFAVIRLIIF